MSDEVGKHSKGALRVAQKIYSAHQAVMLAELISHETSDRELAEALRALLIANSEQAIRDAKYMAEKLLEGL